MQDETRVEVVQGEARARLQAMADSNSIEAGYGAFSHRNATMIADVRNLLAFAAPPAGEMEDHEPLFEQIRATFSPVNYDLACKVIDTIRKPSHPLPADREAIARDLCDASEPRLIAGQEDAPCFDESSANVQEYWLSLADAVAALSPTHPAGRDRSGANYTPFASREECETGAIEAVRLLEHAEEINANCEECEGEGVPELCGSCMPLFDAARVQRRLVMQSLAALPPSTEKGEK